MKILLDECVPWPMSKFLPGHECKSVQQCGWGGLKNGDLLQKAEGDFDVFITADQNLLYQQNLKGFKIGILELSTNDLKRIQAVKETLNKTIQATKPGAFEKFKVP